MILKRGEIHTAATGGGFGGKPRPVLVLQADEYGQSPRTIVALIGSPTPDPPTVRVLVEPTEANGLDNRSEIMVDILVTVPWNKFGKPVGVLAVEDLQRVDRSLLSLLGFASAR